MRWQRGSLVGGVLVALSLAGSGPSGAVEVFDPPAGWRDAATIRAVWDIRGQSCGRTGATNPMKRHPDEERIRTSASLPLGVQGLRVKIPQLHPSGALVLKLNFGDRSRGVVDHYVQIASNDLAAPWAAVVVTELPERMRNRRDAFGAVRTIQEGSLRGAKVPLEYRALEGRFGQALELIVRGRVGSTCFPTSSYDFAPPTLDVAALTISRFELIEGYLVEYALVVSAPPQASADQAARIAREFMDVFWLAVEPAAH